jgi:aminoglycoside phosphotransferase (APT) family kinase protein
MSAVHVTPADLEARLSEYLEATMVARFVAVTELRPLAGGASRDNWLVEIKTTDGRERLLLRRDRSTQALERALRRDEEFLVLTAAHAAGIPVPRPREVCIEAALLEGAFLLTDYQDGISIGRQVVQLPELAAARAALPEQMGRALAQIHALDFQAAELRFLPRPDAGQTPADFALGEIRAAIQKLGVHNPVFEFGLRWLEGRKPICERPVFVHGDFRIGNIMVGAEGLLRVIDWEYAHVGDPAEDLAWPCLRDWRYGKGRLWFGGIAADREPFLKAYEAASGRRIERAAVDFWEALGNLRWAVGCLLQAERHLSGGDHSVELATLGRRSSEMQMELLRLIGQQGV